METHVVIMAGGIGSRLWPVSTPQMPKQFIDLLGVGKSLLQLTVERFEDICPIENFWVVTSAHYVDIVRAQLPLLPSDNILAEPQARNTAPCIAYASWKIALRHPEANVIVTPADAIVLDKAKFVSDIRKSLEFTSVGNAIVTVGITPSRPETGYGYIHAEGAAPGQITKVSEFREKPDLQTAMRYVTSGAFFWNAGIFIWKVSTIKQQLRLHAHGIASIMDELSPAMYTEGEQTELERLFPLCEKISIDYAVMEKSDDIYVLPSDPRWSDLGSWGSVKELAGGSKGDGHQGGTSSDADGNTVVGDDVRLFDCKGCIIHADGAGTVVVDGLQDCIVARKGDNLLVCRLSHEQKIKEYTTPGK